jgi:antitoxin HicB
MGMKTKNLDARVEELAALHHTIVMRQDEEGDFVASIAELDGCVAHGQDAAEALAELASMKRLWIESCLADGKPVPLPAQPDDDLPSGKWLQRVPRTLHRKLTDLARGEGVSLNQYVVSVLAEAVGAHTAPVASDISKHSHVDRSQYASVRARA